MQPGKCDRIEAEMETGTALNGGIMAFWLCRGLLNKGTIQGNVGVL